MIALHIISITTFFSLSTIATSKCNNTTTQKNNNANSPIAKIVYSTTGGRSGNYESLDISTDSLVYIQARRGNEKMIKEKTAKVFWDSLTKSITLQDFDKIKSNPGHALYDGIDTTLSIEAGTKQHTLVNGSEDPVNYSKIRPFTDILEKELVRLRKRIIW
jgi:hypothetical protein